MAGVPINEISDDEWEKLVDEDSLGQASIVSPLPGGSLGPQFGPGADIHPVHIPLMPSKGGGPTLGSAKPTLHKGEPTLAAAGHEGFDIYKSAIPGNSKVYYHYHDDGSPWFASTGETKYDPSEVNFPPPSGVKSQTSAGNKPTLHTGEPQFATPDSAHYATNDGGMINYHWAKGQPWFADYLAPGAKYNEEGHKTYEGDSLHDISWPKVPGPEDYAKGKPKVSEAQAKDAGEKFDALLSSPSQIVWPDSNWRAYENLYAEHHAPFTDEERAALKSGASSIAGRLWKDRLGDLDPDRIERMRLLDSALDKSAIPTNLRVWSGVNSKVWQDISHMDQGEIFLHKGYMSTSLDRDTAEQFISDSGAEDYSSGSGGLLRIHVPEGSRGIILGRLGPLPEENETLLPRGVMLRKMTDSNGESNGIVDVEVIPGLGAYHGSHAQFDKFDLSKAGSGEGTAQIESFTQRPSVPKGIFLAQSEKVGEKYREKLAEEKLGDPAGGWLYKIHVQAHPKELFDWNKPYSQQSPQVRSALDRMYEEHYQRPVSESSGAPPGIGKALLDQYGPNAIERLAKYGVKGIRFLDKHSRKLGHGTQNYVIFDDNIMQIIGKKGSGESSK